MTLVFEVIAFLILIMAIVSVVVTLRDASQRRQRRLHADVQDGMPDEIDNLPSNADGSTDSE